MCIPIIYLLFDFAARQMTHGGTYCSIKCLLFSFRAVDDDLSTYSATLIPVNPWWLVDLQDTYIVDEARIHFKIGESREIRNLAVFYTHRFSHFFDFVTKTERP